MTEDNKNLNIKEELERAYKSFTSAEILYTSGQYNDAISRLYYALFHTIKALLLSEGIEPKSNEGTLTLFAKQFVKTGIFTKEDYEEFKTDYDSLLNKIQSFLKTKGYI